MEYKHLSPFSLDDRVKPDVLRLAREIVAGTQIIHGSVAERKQRGEIVSYTELVNVHFTILASSVTDSALILIAHGNGRDAQILERAQYEYYLNAAYFAPRHEEAALYYLSAPARRIAEYQKIDVTSGPQIDALKSELENNKALLNPALAARLDNYSQPGVETMENTLLAEPKKSRALKYARTSWIVHGRSIATRQTVPIVDNKLNMKFNPITEFPNQEIIELGFLMMQVLRIAADVHHLDIDKEVREYYKGITHFKEMLEREFPEAYSLGGGLFGSHST
jgi:hypothetical protein